MKYRHWIGSAILLVVILGVAGALAAWKSADLAAKAAAVQPDMVQSIAVAEAKSGEHRRTTTAIGTVLALRSITLRNELPGTVRKVNLVPGQIVEEGTLLVALDVAVEEAELHAQEAEAALSEAMVRRMEQASQDRAASEMEVDRVRAERDIARAQVERTQAIIDRKTIRAPFKARVGLADVHIGQYLDEGTTLSTLQGVDDEVHVDFSVGQLVAANLREGQIVELFCTNDSPPLDARIVAVDARVDPATRNAWVRARIANKPGAPAAGASVRVKVPVGPPATVVKIPANALRRGPGGTHVFVIGPGQDGQTRAHQRPVECGSVLGNEVVVYSGLTAGEQVATSGSFKLHEGALVAIAGAARH